MSQSVEFSSISKRILYVVNHSFPYSSNGYAVRTHGVAVGLVQHGYEVVVVNRPGRPWDLNNFSGECKGNHQQDGVRYYFIPEPARADYSEYSEWMQDATAALIEAAMVFRPEVIMAASNWENAWPAMNAARQLGLPFFYEVRGFWELSRISRQPEWANSKAYQDARLREVMLAEQSARVFTINPLMQDYMAAQGVDENKITLLPNAVSCLPEITEKAVLNFTDTDFIVGYIGTFSPYEGLELLIEASALARKAGVRVSLLFVGSSQKNGLDSDEAADTETQLSELANTLGFASYLQIVPRVEPSALAPLYAAIDLLVNPRLDTPVTGVVSAIKPLEAVAYGKAVLLSDLPPNQLLANECSSIRLFPAGHVHGLSKAIQRLVVDEKFKRACAKNGPRWCKEQRTFELCVSEAVKALATEKFAVVQPPLLVPVAIHAGWQAVKAGSGDFIRINLQSFCSLDTERHLLLAVRMLNQQGELVAPAVGDFFYSKSLDAYFRYLPSKKQARGYELEFLVPADVVSVEYSVRGHMLPERTYAGVFDKKLKVYPPKKPGQFPQPSVKAAELSIVGWPEPELNSKPVVMAVMDEFTTGCFGKEVRLVQPRPDNWFALAEKYQPCMIFIESAWKGNFGSWQFRIAEYSNKPGPELNELCSYARSKQIPVVFWNKEDPVHHSKFMEAAKQADVIFTTDQNMLPSYTEKTANPRVYPLPFAAQPALHKPAALNGRYAKSCFAGSWYGNRHAERGVSMEWLLDAANKFELDIYDRNFGTGVFPFPEKYNAGIKGSLPYEVLCDEYNKYRIFLNVNSVTDSPTMFSRRVFELMACGTPVVSTYAHGIEAMFQSDAVWLIHSAEEAEHAIRTLMTDDTEWRRRSLAGIREVFTSHTYAHRLDTVFRLAGVQAPVVVEQKVYLIFDIDSEQDISRAAGLLKQQSYKKIVPVYVLNKPELKPAKVQGDALWLKPGSLVEQLSVVDGFVGRISIDKAGKHLVRDLVNATSYQSDADVWGVGIEQLFCWSLSIQPDAMLVRPSMVQWLAESSATTDLMKVFAIDTDQYSC